MLSFCSPDFFHLALPQVIVCQSHQCGGGVSLYIYVLCLPAEMVTKICTDSGHWFLHPESNRTWTNYTRCNEHTNEGRVVGHFDKNGTECIEHVTFIHKCHVHVG